MKVGEYGFGWNPQPEDSRDMFFHLFRPEFPVEALPEELDLRGGCPIIYNQGRLGSCTANAIAGAYEYEMKRQKRLDFFTPSRLFIYFNEREMEGSIATDAGAYIRDGIKSVNRQGVIPEDEWPYVPAKFAERPPQSCYEHALTHQVLEYLAIERDLDELRLALFLGYPVVFGFMVYTSFMSQLTAKTGKMTMPTAKDKLEGGHAVVLVGYSNSTRTWIVRNSWGPDWGDHGYFYMPFEYLRFASDFWTIRMIE